VKLLLFVPEGENQIDEVLMAVPTDYDREYALTEATDALGGAVILAEEMDVLGEGVLGLSDYRPYVG
jgi:hypothetical protein